MTYIAFKFLLCWNFFVPVLNACTDRTPLGMANGLINASHISASSTWDLGQITASRGRLYSSGVWCSKAGKSAIDYLKEWFQVRFNSATTINGIAIQGDPNWAANFIRKFRLQYSADGTNWLNKSKKVHTFQEFTGNVNNAEVVYNWFTTPIIATHVRLYATHIHRHGEKNGHACMRMELYGCLHNNISLPLGMSSGIIKDTQLQNSRGNDARKARLFLPGNGMYATSNNPIYLQVDLINAKTVTGISMQGVFRKWAALKILKYTLSYSNNKTTFTQFNQDFQENKDLGAVFNPLKPPTTMKHIRITTTICARIKNTCGIKVEIYGYDPKCSQMLTDMITSRKNGSSVTNVNIDSPTAWCATDASDYIHIKFNKQLAISGIILQGDSNEDGWVEAYTINYGVSTNRETERLIGVNSRISPLSVNWLNPYIVTNYLRIIPKSCKNDRCCLRFELKGCTFVLEKPHTINGDMLPTIITFTWEAPISHPLPVDKYHLIISASKNYPHKPFFQTINTTTSNLKYSVSIISFAAANVQINITADIQGVMTSAEPFNFVVQPKDPPSPGLDKRDISNKTNNATIVTLTSSSDRNGPISYYEIVISTSSTANLPNQLKSQAESELKNLDYFLAATVKTDDLLSNSIQYTFVEGKEYIASLNARISAVGTYYLYARAVIDGKDIASYGFNNVNYFGHLSKEIIIERNALGKIVPEIVNSTKTSVMLVKGPATLKYHYIIIMKVNKTTAHVKEPTLYKQKELKTYETADYNEPYIAGIFNKTQLLKLEEFILGDNSTYLKSADTLRRRRSIQEYRNGPLTAGEIYVVFQRLQVMDVLYSTAWSKKFIVPKIDPTPKVENNNDPSSSSNIELIVGVVAAGVVVVIVMILVLIFVRRRRKTLKDKSVNDKSTSAIELKGHYELKSHNNGYEKEDAGPSHESYYNVAAKPRFPPLSLQDFLSFYLEHNDNVSSDIVKQFKSIPLEHLYHNEVGSEPENKDKNRYLNITAYDHTRVVLQKINGKETSDYINANYIRNYNGQVEYIAAQGPKKGTIFDFWRMVLGEKPSAIVMLTKISEEGKRKCEQYWPINNGKEVFNGIAVEVIDVQVYADYVIRKIKVCYENNKHQITHFHFTSWPHHGCPDYPTLLLNFCYRVRQLIPYESGKQLLVHCSAGVGRTGSYIIIDAMLHLVRTKQLVDIYNYFESIREDRVQIVQKIEQYKFVYSAIYEALCCGNTGIMSSEFQTTSRELISKKRNGKFLLENEFERLNSVNIPFREENYKAALLEKNAAKNRYPNILASDLFRVYVPQTTNSTDYINAVFVNGYKKKDGIIATQAPLVDTLGDFWEAVMANNVTTIVMLNSTDENYQTYPSFCPVEGSEKFGNLTVNVESSTRVGDINLQSFIISNKKNHRKVNKLQLNWPNHDIPDCSSLLTLIGEVLKSQQSYGDGTILVTCSDGANRSGTFIACMNALDQLKVEQHVDIFQTVRRMRLVRPEFVENIRQYQFVYTVLNKYLDSFATYSNFN
ncbi:receptor-type tyrosine-protein phosphatase S-like isoform X2 [Hydractinia symbiolongicarpus]|uniref:receptor-type tyrosine-protein phosphatase S-like isoform X2 n=1 Tax=Hydractinia symbiolongicarpus TaxID=13093 RepID=UPI00254C47C9|nr:receptor-type tyrosine-protein phosphatase S-like isoform X2 [Hydractinia symbiolongicarpus]